MAVNVFLIAVASAVILAVAVVMMTFLFVRLVGLTRHFLEALVLSRLLTWLGAVIALAGVVITVWLEVSLDTSAYGHFAATIRLQERLQDAGLGASIIGAGALLAVAAQILGMMQGSRAQSSNGPVPTSGSE